MKTQLLQKILRFASYFNLIIWNFLGMLTIGSIFTESNSELIMKRNLIIGMLFITIGCFGFLKSINSLKLIKTICNENSLQLLIKKLLWGELFLMLFFGIISTFSFVGAIYRVFKEHLPVFG